MSRSCTDEGWTDLVPSSYDIACGMAGKEPDLDEVGLSAPHPRQAPSTLSHRGEEVAGCAGARTPGLCPPRTSSLAKRTSPGACPLAPPDEGAFLRRTQSSQSCSHTPWPGHPLPAGTLLWPPDMTREGNTILPGTWGRKRMSRSWREPTVSQGQGRGRDRPLSPRTGACPRAGEHGWSL